MKETGALPKMVGLVAWGTSAMRTGGDDIAEVFALLGVKPVWHSLSRRVTGVAVVPLEELGRPRIDVTIRISGFFRDAFPHLVGLIDDAVAAVAGLDSESDEDNYVRRPRARGRSRAGVRSRFESGVAACDDPGVRIEARHLRRRAAAASGQG